MPSPLGHIVAGLTVHVASARPEAQRDAGRAALLAGLAVAPDLDLLARYVDGRNHHQAQSHSLGAALIAAAVVWLVARARGLARPALLALAAGAAWSSHVLLDYLSRDTNPPIGIMALWPLSDAYFKFPVPLFLDIGRTLEWRTLWNNAVAAAWEMTLLLPLLWLAVRWRSGARR